MTAPDWPDPHAADVERALKMQKGSILAREVLALRAQIAALTAEHSGACDDMAVCGNCWTAERVDAAFHAEAQVAAVRALHSRDERKAAMGLDHCAGCSTHVTFTPWPCKTVQALDAPQDATP